MPVLTEQTSFSLPWRQTGAGFCPQHVKGFSRFRFRNADEEEVSSLLRQVKRQKKEASCMEEEFLNYAYHLVSDKGKE